MRNASERKSPFSSSPLHCEVALGLNMHPTASYSCDGGGGGSPFFSGLNNQPYIYELGNGVLLQRGLDTSSPRPSVCGKALFTSSQLQELERQKIIHKYITASIPVPPQLLLSTSISPPPSSLSQCNMELRYSSSSSLNGNGSDPEPWRCKRTDGKKWRCSRDVAPDHKYCERHAHKNRPRSRKHVEISSHTPKSSAPSLPRSSSSSSQFPYQQSRCIEWLMKGGGSDDNEGTQLEQLMRMPSPKSNNHNLSAVYHPHFAEKQDFVGGSDHGMSSEGSRAAATRLFIDAWGKEGMSMNKVPAAEKKAAWTSSSLSLRMGEGGGGGGIDDHKGDSGIFKNHQWPNNPISWLSSLSSSSPAPGGPLGEALCLGNGGSSLVSSPRGHSHSHSHGYSNSSKSSCEDGSHALNFIG